MDNKIELKVEWWNILRNYYGYVFTNIFFTVLLLMGLINNVVFIICVFLLTMVELISIPLLLEYLRVSKSITVDLKNQLIIKYDLNFPELNRKYSFSEIESTVLVKPMYNKGGFSFGEYHFCRVNFVNGEHFIITDIMCRNDIEILLEGFPKTKQIRVLSLYCSIKKAEIEV